MEHNRRLEMKGSDYKKIFDATVELNMVIKRSRV